MSFWYAIGKAKLFYALGRESAKPAVETQFTAEGIKYTEDLGSWFVSNFSAILVVALIPQAQTRVPLGIVTSTRPGRAFARSPHLE